MQDAEVRKAYLKLALHHPDKAATCKCVTSLCGASASTELHAQLRLEAEAVFKLVQDAKVALASSGKRAALHDAIQREKRMGF